MNFRATITGAALALALAASTAGTAAAYSSTVEQWRPTVQDACGGSAACEDRIMWLISCESGGNPAASVYNPSSGNLTNGLLQIDEIWGSVSYADGATQIYWTAEHLGSVWWAC